MTSRRRNMTSANKKRTAKEEKFNFEKAMEELKQIQIKLESGNLPLEQAIEQFEHGSVLVNKCRKALEHAEQRVKILTQNNAKPEPFESEDG